MRLAAVFGLPERRDVARGEHLNDAAWDEVVAIATRDLAARARYSLLTYVALLALSAWGSGAFATGADSEWLIVGLATLGFLFAGAARQVLIADPHPSAEWWRLFGVLTLAHAAFIAALGARLTFTHGVTTRVLPFWLVLAGVSAGATTALKASPVLGQLFLWTTLCPLIATVATVATGREIAVALIVLTYLVFMSDQARRSTVAYWNGNVAEVLLKEQAVALDGARISAQDALAAQTALVDELGSFRTQAERDYKLAGRIFARIMDRSCFRLSSLRASVTPAERFNGDLVMATPTREGGLRLFLGDFTGHGLSAAVGAPPIAEEFFASAATGKPLETTIREMNTIVRRTFPRGFFLAAFLAELDLRQGRLLYWNGGLPAQYVLGETSQIIERLSSVDPPLGVLGDGELVPACKVTKLLLGQRLFTYSDGVTEAEAPNGELFGEARLEAVLQERTSNDFRSTDVQRALSRHREGDLARDDVTMLELRNDLALPAELARLEDRPQAETAYETASLRVRFEPEALRLADPLGRVRTFLETEMPSIEHASVAYTVVEELFVNAVDHGLLGLSSVTKSGREGFDSYFETRKAALVSLREGAVNLEVSVSQASDRREVRVRIRDSGLGFTPAPGGKSAPNSGETALSGRGLTLVRVLANDVRWSDGGRSVEARLDLPVGALASAAFRSSA